MKCVVVPKGQVYVDEHGIKRCQWCKRPVKDHIK